MTQFRQGDVLIELIGAVADLPSTATIRPRDNGRLILAYGEVTGHVHAVLDAPMAAIYDDPNATDGSFYLTIGGPSGVIHEEHGRIDLDPGLYRVQRQREWTDEDEPRQVAD